MPGKKQTKLDDSQTSAHCATEKSGYDHIPLKSPQNLLQGEGKRGKKRARVSKRQTKQNKIGEPANDHKAPWPYVTNKGRERRDNVRQVVLIKGIAVPSVDHFTNC